MWFPLCNYTHYSILGGYSRPGPLVRKCVENGYKACGIADYHSMGGAVKFCKACADVDVKPIVGVSFDRFKLFAKNKDGWYDLIKIVSSIRDDTPDVTVLRERCDRGNLFCVADSEADSPISGDDFYIKSEVFRSSYYVDKQDAELHRILLCLGMKTTLPKVQKLLQKNEPFDNDKFFKFDDFHVRDKDEFRELQMMDEENPDALSGIFEKCEEYQVLSGPKLPSFPTPNGETEAEHLKELCRQGWREKLGKPGKVKDPELKDEYHQRFVREFGVIEGANLFGYFLIVRDIINFCHRSGWITGPGRGSAAGCLISYLLGITNIDPIEYGLLFERFYNQGRNTGDHISLPDIDMDVPKFAREAIIAYMKETFGEDHVGQVITFGSLKGKSAIKAVLSVHEAAGFGEQNEITKYMPDEGLISDQLQQMDEEDRSIIRWSLEHNAQELMYYCHLTDDGELEGEFSEYFKQAIAMEGTYRSIGKHAAGVVITRDPIKEVCPVIPDAGGEGEVCGWEMNDLSDVGHEKFDVLGLKNLDDNMWSFDLIEERYGVDLRGKFYA